MVTVLGVEDLIGAGLGAGLGATGAGLGATGAGLGATGAGLGRTRALGDMIGKSFTAGSCSSIKGDMMLWEGAGLGAAEVTGVFKETSREGAGELPFFPFFNFLGILS